MDKRNSTHGEGDPKAAERFNEAEPEFVKSARGKRAIRRGARVSPDEESALNDAELRGRERSKGEDLSADNEG